MELPPAEIDSWGWRGTTQGSQMKNTTGWTAGQNGTNTSGFSALPGGYRYAATGTFNDRGNLSYWWTSTTVDATTGMVQASGQETTLLYTEQGRIYSWANISDVLRTNTLLR